MQTLATAAETETASQGKGAGKVKKSSRSAGLQKAILSQLELQIFRIKLNFTS